MDRLKSQLGRWRKDASLISLEQDETKGSTRRKGGKRGSLTKQRPFILSDSSLPPQHLRIRHSKHLNGSIFERSGEDPDPRDVVVVGVFIELQEP